MPKFTEQEKEQIRQSLLAKGRALFAAQGLGKTSIDEIVASCGIAKGSFYKFFATKEELYWEILHSEQSIQGRLLQELSRRDGRSPKARVADLLKHAMRMADENPFLQPIFEKGEYERLVRKLPEHVRARAAEARQTAGTSVIAALMADGQLAQDDPRIVAGIFHAIMLLRLHREQIGEDLFPLVIDRIIDSVADGLTP